MSHSLRCPVLLLLLACSFQSHAPDGGTDAGGKPDGSAIAESDAAVSQDAAPDAPEEPGTVDVGEYCLAACDKDPPICREYVDRGTGIVTSCYDLCSAILSLQIELNEPRDGCDPCVSGPVYLIECLAVSPGACEEPEGTFGCGDDWQEYYYCQSEC